MRICNEDLMEFVTTMAEEEYGRSVKTNVFIAAFTTSHAHLKLYGALNTLKERVLYYDTEQKTECSLKWSQNIVIRTI